MMQLFLYTFYNKSNTNGYNFRNGVMVYGWIVDLCLRMIYLAK